MLLQSKGYDAEVGYNLGSLVVFAPTAAGAGRGNYHREDDAFKMTLANYEFTDKMSHGVLFDMDYVVLCTGN